MIDRASLHYLHDGNDVPTRCLEDLLVFPSLVAPSFVSLRRVAVAQAGGHVVVVAEPNKSHSHQSRVLVCVHITKPYRRTDAYQSNDVQHSSNERKKHTNSIEQLVIHARSRRQNWFCVIRFLYVGMKSHQ